MVSGSGLCLLEGEFIIFLSLLSGGDTKWTGFQESSTGSFKAVRMVQNFKFMFVSVLRRNSY